MLVLLAWMCISGANSDLVVGVMTAVELDRMALNLHSLSGVGKRRRFPLVCEEKAKCSVTEWLELSFWWCWWCGWCAGSKRLVCMRSLILAFCGLLLLGSTVAFLLYVSLLSILSVVLILLAAMLMFLLGMRAERQRRRVPAIPSEETMRCVQGTHTAPDTRRRSATQTIETRSGA